MFTRPPPDNAPSPFSPDRLPFLFGGYPSAASEEARLFGERVKLHREKLQAEREELERAQAAADAAWNQAEEARCERRAKIKEQALKAEIEWERMGGRIRNNDEADALLRRRLDTDASLTQEDRALKQAWEEYDLAWNRLTTSVRPAKKFTFRKLAFTFAEVPWPILCPPSSESDTECVCDVRIEDITTSAVAKFLLHPLRDPQKSRKEKLREAILRYHPDKFEGKILPRVVAEDRIRVREAIGVVMKCLNELMVTDT